MAINFQTKTTIRAVDKFSGPMGKMQKNMATFHRKYRGLIKTGEKFRTVGKRMAIGVGLPVAAAAGASMKAFASYEDQILKVKTLLDDDSFKGKTLNQGFKEMSKDLLKLTTEIPVDLAAGTTALFDAVSAGVDKDKAIPFLKDAGKLAVAGGTDVSTATDGMTSAMNAWGVSSEKSGLVAAKFFTAQKAGKTTIEKLSNSIGKVAPIAAGMGVSLNETFAATAALTLGGLETSEAMTALKAGFSNILKPASKAGKLAEKLNLDFSAKAIKNKGLLGVLGEVKEKTKGSPELLGQLFGSVEALNAVMALTGKQSGAFKSTLATLNNNQGIKSTFGAAYKTQSESAKNRLKLIQNQAKVLSIGFGEKLMPYTNKVMEFASKTLDWISANKELAKTFGKIIVGIIAAGGALWTLGAAVKGITNIKLAVEGLKIAFGVLGKHPAFLVIGGLALLGTAIYKNWGGIGDFFSELWDSVAINVAKAWFEIKNSFLNNVIVQKIISVWQAIPDFFTNMWQSVKSMFAGGIVFILEKVKGLAQAMQFTVFGKSLGVPDEVIKSLDATIGKYQTIANASNMPIQIAQAMQSPAQLNTSTGEVLKIEQAANAELANANQNTQAVNKIDEAANKMNQAAQEMKESSHNLKLIKVDMSLKGNITGANTSVTAKTNIGGNTANTGFNTMGELNQ